ncbi:hypothetical protein HDV05_008626, partial [Chytridiales sp. JEL 0842]
VYFFLKSSGQDILKSMTFGRRKTLLRTRISSLTIFKALVGGRALVQSMICDITH